MIVARYVARVVLLAVVCAFATVWFGWLSVPVVGFVYGIADRRARAHGTVAALGGALGWLGILGAHAARGADIRAVAERVGGVLMLPGVAFILVTLVFTALLSGLAAVIGASVGALAMPAARNPAADAGAS